MGKLNRYNQMMAYLTRPPRPQQQETSVERLGMMAGGLPKIKQMIDFILKNADKVSTVGGKISREFLEFMAEKNPQNIKNVYLDVVKRLGIGVDVGKAPKTDLKKVKSKVEADKRITKELAENEQIPVKNQTDLQKDLENITDLEISKSYKQALEGNDLDLSDDKYDAQILADYVANNRYRTDFYDLPQDH